MTYSPQITERTLYRGQSRDHGVVLASGWRKFWNARQVLTNNLRPLAQRYLEGALAQSAFEEELSTIAASAEEAPTIHWFLKSDGGRRSLIDRLHQIRDSFAPEWHSRILQAQLSELEKAFFLRYQSYLFNDTEDDFLKPLVPSTLRPLAQLLMEFYDAHRSSFDVDQRIAQVAMDFMGVLQQYGALDTPGIDFTDDLEIALWFATHFYDWDNDSYHPLPADKLGWIYEFKVPVVAWRVVEAAEPGEALPKIRAVDLSTLSPLLVRIQRQRGYYAIHNSGWDRILDFGSLLPMKKRPVVDYVRPEAIKERLAARALTDDYLFPQDDPFKSHLVEHGVKTFR